MKNYDRRIAALERRYGPTVDHAEKLLICQIVAREHGIDPQELWAEATRLATEATRFPNHAAHVRHVADQLGITVAELEADMRRIDEAMTKELAR